MIGTVGRTVLDVFMPMLLGDFYLGDCWDFWAYGYGVL